LSLKRVAQAIVALACGLLAATALAHRTSLAHVELRLDREQPLLTVDVSTHDLAAGLGVSVDGAAPVPPGLLDRDAAAAWAMSRIALSRDDRPCGMAAEVVAIDAERERISITFECAPSRDTAAVETSSLRYRLFHGVDPRHVAIGRAIRADSDAEDLLFDADFDTWRAERGSRTVAGSLWGLFRAGLHHILTGWDHVLFVIALVLPANGLVSVVRLVTAFTLGHAITLALAWFDVLRLPGAPVEVAIAMTVLFVAVAGLAGCRVDRWWPCAGLFGLAHGLGFFGALDPGLAGDRSVMALAGFNAGVEAGQLLIVVPLAWLLAKLPAVRPAATRWGSAGIACLALWWTVERISAV